MPARKVVVVIPTYNERDNIRAIVPQVLQAIPCEVIIVDDESPDGTAAVVEEMAREDSRVHLVRHAPKLGIGPAYKAGFEAALRTDAQFVVQMDADFSHAPEMLPTLVAAAEDADLVLGSRYIRGITVMNWPIERLLLSYVGNWYARRATGMPIRDVTGGFKCWRRSALEAIGIGRVRAAGYAFQIETTFRAWRRRLRIREVPIVFIDRTVGESKMTKRIGLEALWIAPWLRLAQLVGRL